MLTIVRRCTKLPDCWVSDATATRRRPSVRVFLLVEQGARFFVLTAP